ncbi:MAG TPA: hypothetical protein VFW40_10900, partial [Capsulimonadaceae bacterium]|nr:hypothetical protein [Capsulimonadaceae bacterium]
PVLFQGPAVADWDGRIGAPVLANFVLTFDYAHSRLYVRPAQAPSTPPGATQPATIPATTPPTSTPPTSKPTQATP